MTPKIGDTIAGQWRLKELLGKGGMGLVFRATDKQIGGDVALKLLDLRNIDETKLAEIEARFLNEIYTIRNLVHDHIVKVTHSGRAEGGVPFFVMELLRGVTLQQHIQSADKPIEIAQAIDWAVEICSAVTHCHALDVLHRDLKPSNIFLTLASHGQMRVKVLDFGVSKGNLGAELTRQPSVLGTPKWMAPEQLTGESTPQSDQYAVGAVLYYILTGVEPFASAGTDYQQQRAIAAGQYRPIKELRPEVPKPLREIIQRAMHVNPHKRYDSVYDLHKALHTYASPALQYLWKPYFSGAAPKPMTPTLSEQNSTEILREISPRYVTKIRFHEGATSGREPFPAGAISGSTLNTAEPAPTRVQKPSHSLLARADRSEAEEGATIADKPVVSDSASYSLISSTDDSVQPSSVSVVRPARRANYFFAAGVGTVLGGALLAIVLRRPEHLIRPAMFSPALPTAPAPVPPPPALPPAVQAPPPAAVASPPTDSPAAAPAPAPSAVLDPPPAPADPEPKPRHRRRRRPVQDTSATGSQPETSPDGILLLP